MLSKTISGLRRHSYLEKVGFAISFFLCENLGAFCVSGVNIGTKEPTAETLSTPRIRKEFRNNLSLLFLAVMKYNSPLRDGRQKLIRSTNLADSL